MRMTASHLGRLRQAAGLTQLQAAAKLGIHQTILSDLERGEQLPSADRAGELARLYRLTLEQVLRAARKDALGYARRLAQQRRPA